MIASNLLLIDALPKLSIEIIKNGTLDTEDLLLSLNSYGSLLLNSFK